jgi:hypothetical protein
MGDISAESIKKPVKDISGVVDWVIDHIRTSVRRLLA